MSAQPVEEIEQTDEEKEELYDPEETIEERPGLFSEEELFNTRITVFGKVRRSGKEGFSDFSWRSPDITVGTPPSKEHERKYRAICQMLGVTTLYIPHLDFSAEEAKLEDFAVSKEKGKAAYIFPIGDGCVVRTGGRGDCMRVPSKEAVLFYGGDCPSLVVTDKHSVVVAHCGRDALWDRNYILDKQDAVPRPRESVVQTVCEMFPYKSRLYAHLTTGISPQDFSHPFDHPVYGKDNEQMVTFLSEKWGEVIVGLDLSSIETGMSTSTEGYINMRALVHSQFEFFTELRAQRVEHFGDDLCRFNTYTEERLWSYRRSRDCGEPDGRNAIVVTHR